MIASSFCVFTTSFGGNVYVCVNVKVCIIRRQCVSILTCKLHRLGQHEVRDEKVFDVIARSFSVCVVASFLA